jgi:hypothetical protein
MLVDAFADGSSRPPIPQVFSHFRMLQGELQADGTRAPATVDTLDREDDLLGAYTIKGTWVFVRNCIAVVIEVSKVRHCAACLLPCEQEEQGQRSGEQAAPEAWWYGAI